MRSHGSATGKVKLLRRVRPLLVSAILLLLAPLARAQSLTATSVPNVAYPNRTVVLSVPPRITATQGTVHVTENGRPVHELSVTSLKQARLGDLGVVLVIDTDPSMQGAPLNQALAAARTLAAQRSGAEEIGVVFGDGVTLPLTSDPRAINAVLARPPTGHAYRNLITMTQEAVDQLNAAAIQDRAIIYVTDDIDREPGWTSQGIGAYARAAHVRIFTVGVRDAISTNPLPTDLPADSMRQLAAAAGGTYSAAVPAQERQAFLDIEAGLTSQYIVRYRSVQPSARRIIMTIRVDGVPGAYSTTYLSPAPLAAPHQPATVHHQSFWASSTAVVVVAITCGLLLGGAIALLAYHFARAGRLRMRMEPFLPSPPQIVVERPADGPPRVGLWHRLLERRRWWPSFVEQVSISAYKKSPEQLAAFASGGSFIAVVLVYLITGSGLIAILGLLVGPLVVRGLVRRSVRQQRQRFAEELPGQLHELASAMRTGRSMVEGVEIVAEATDEPMRREIRQVLADERIGMHLDEALVPVATRMDSAEIEQVAAIAALHRRTGAHITEVLDRIADTARQRVELRRELNGLTAQARLSRNILTALPIFVIIAIDLVGHQYEKPLFHTTAGILVLCLAAVMVGFGRWIMKQIVHVEE